MKVWENWKDISSAMKNLNNRNCWKVCNNCQKKWKDTLTKMVHMIVLTDDGKPLTRFICDNCLSEQKEK